MTNEDSAFMRTTVDHFYNLAAVAPGVLLHKLDSGLAAFLEALVTTLTLRASPNPAASHGWVVLHSFLVTLTLTQTQP